MFPEFDPVLSRLTAKLRTASAHDREVVYQRARLSIGTLALQADADRAPASHLEREALERAIARIESEMSNDVVPQAPVTLASEQPGAGSGGAAVQIPADAGATDGRRRLAVNALAGAGANAIKIGIQLFLLPLMAHLLGPAEFGLYALALPAVNFFSVLADGGLGNSLAREDESARLVWSTAFWVLLATGVALALVVTGWGYLMAPLAREPRLSGLMAFLSISLVLITMSVLPSARLTRRGNLVVYAGADLGSTIVGAVLAVSLATRGAGAWSLAVQYVSGFLVRAVVLNAAAFYRPSLVFKLSTLGPHLATGSAILGSRLSDFAGRLVENLVFGRSFGPAALGAFTLANQVPRFICEAAQNPVWAALYAHALHAEAKDLAALHRKLVSLLTCALFPVAFLLAASAPPVVNFLLGEKWASAATLIQILTPFYALNAAAMQSGAILLAMNRNATVFIILAGSSLGRVLSVCAGPWVGLDGVAWGIGLTYLVVSVAMFIAPSRVMGTSTGRLVGGLIPPLVASAAGGLVTYACLRVQATTLPWIAASLAAGTVTYAAILIAIEGRRLWDDVAALRHMASRGRRGSPA